MGRAVVTDVDTPRQTRRANSKIGLPLQLLTDLRVYGERAASKDPHFFAPKSPRPCIEESRK